MCPFARRVVGIVVGLGLLCLPGSALAAPTITEYAVPTHNRQPLGIAAGPDGNVWFTQSVSPGGIARSSMSGSISEFFTGISSGAQGIVAGPDGDLWFVEPAADKIAKITTSGTVQSFSAANGSEPSTITSGPDGNLWFTEPGGKGAIGRITTSGTITSFTSGLTQNSQPEDIAAGPDGNLWFTEGANPGRIARITTSGTITEFTTGLTKDSHPEGITAGPDGNLWFTEAANPGRIGRITTSGAITEFTSGLTQNVGPAAITTGNDGNLYFTEPFNYGKIGEITPAGVISEYPTPTSFSAPEDIVTGPDGNLWFTEAANPGHIAMMTVAPKVASPVASAVSEQTATLGASIGANSQATTYRFEFGTTTGYGTQTSSSSAGSGAASVPVSASLSGLAPSTTYHFRALATNATGTTYGADQTFTTTSRPAVLTQSATSVGLTSATLTGGVNPEGHATTYHFEWGTTSAYGSNAPASDASVGSDSVKHPLEQALTGLTPDQTYHFRIVATNCGGCAEGTSYGADETFTSASPPTATTEAAEALSLTGATLTGLVNPRGASTTYHFDWGTTTAYGNQAPTVDERAGSDEAAHAVSESLSGLVAGTTYHYRLVVTNCGGCAAGTTYGADMTLTIASTPVPLSGVEASPLETSPNVIGRTAPTGIARGVVAPPQVGRTAVVHALAGTVLVRLPGSGAAQPIGQGDIPVGALIDASEGRVLLTTALDTHGTTQSATVWGNAFVVRQTAIQHGMTRSALAGTRPSGCCARASRSSSAAARVAKSGQSAHTLWASDHNGHYSTRGQNSVATVRGTYWGTVERCAGTLTIVRRGAVSVRRLHGHGSVLVRAGHSYLARS